MPETICCMELNGVSSPRHLFSSFSHHSTSLFHHRVLESVKSLTPLRRPSLFFYPQLSFRSFPTTPSCPPSSPVSQFMRQELCPSPPRLERRGSSGIPRVAPLSSSSVLPSPLPPPPRLWLLLPSPGVVSLPSGPPLKW